MLFAVATCEIPTYIAGLHASLQPKLNPDHTIMYEEDMEVTCDQYVPTPIVMKHKCLWDCKDDAYKFDRGDLKCPGK